MGHNRGFDPSPRPPVREVDTPTCDDLALQLHPLHLFSPFPSSFPGIMSHSNIVNNSRACSDGDYNDDPCLSFFLFCEMTKGMQRRIGLFLLAQ